jgi:N,N-dimethylformamidase
VTGSSWNGDHQRWSEAPDQYGAIHFHHDDLYDAGWETDLTLTVPDDLASGVYALRLETAAGVDHVPFYVRAPAGRRSQVAFLASTATYLAYANHRMTVAPDQMGVIDKREVLLPEQQFMVDNPVGLSMYEYHPDGSGVVFSSWRRPVLNLKPYVELWTFTADLNVIAWLEHGDHDYDVLTDEDLHREGAAALDGYRVIVTGAHPEYWSTAMLDTLEGYLSSGGRMMYVGGNGFYWRVAFSDEWPGAMEVRRAEDGTRGWIAEPGEYYHAFTGEYGGLWRRLGRAPNRICGVGFAAQGFSGASPYLRNAASRDPAVSWVFDGVDPDAEVVGDHGAGGGAAGQEIDRYDVRLGSPRHAWVLASATEHDPTMLRTKEEFHATELNRPHRDVRADLVLFATGNGGGVFSTGSIAWAAALATDGYENDVAAISTNVLDRFALDEDLDIPPAPPA